MNGDYTWTAVTSAFEEFISRLFEKYADKLENLGAKKEE